MWFSQACGQSKLEQNLSPTHLVLGAAHLEVLPHAFGG
jgi:hypothetical protein